MRRLHLLMAMLFSFALVAAACGSADDANAVADAANDAVEGPEDAEGDGDSDTDTPDSAATGDFVGTIKIGAALSESGKYVVEGKDSRQGYNTWAKWVNEEYGGIKLPDGAYEVEMVYYDDESDADTAVNLTQKLISEDKVDFLLGPYSSGLTGPASAQAESNNILMIEGNGTSNSLFERDYKNLFLVATIASDYTKSGIEAFAEEGAKTAVLAYEDTAFPTAVAEGAKEHLAANGIELLATETYPKDPTDLTPIISKFNDLDPDVFIGGGHYIDAVLFINAAKDTGFDPDGMLITVGPSNPKLTEELGDDVINVVGPTQWEATMAYEGQWFGSAADYAALYESYWNEPPVYQSASATASALALHIAIETAGTTDTDAVREALQNMDASTFYGPISFDENGVNRAKPMGTIQVQGDGINVVAPDAAAVADLEYPKN